MLMQYFMHQPMCPLRATASDASEMVSQLLFGDQVTLLDRDRQWLHVRLDSDGYEGWIDEKSVLPLDGAALTAWHCVLEDALLLQTARAGTTLPLRLSLGMRLPDVRTGPVAMPGEASTATRLPDVRTGPAWTLGDWTLYLGAHVPTEAPAFSAEAIVGLSARYLGTPYLWGGKTLAGIDCSGLTQMVFGICGRSLPRDARDQALIGSEIAFEARAAGDLAFFENAAGKVHHVGIVLPDGNLRHASGHVHDAVLTHEGIVGKYTGQQTHRLCRIKRIS